MSVSTDDASGPNRRREFLVGAGRGAALAGLTWLVGGLALRSWSQPAGTPCRLATACGNCARRERCEYPELRDAQRREQ